MEKVPGCWEHVSMVWGPLKEACKTKTNLATIWFDIANAYRSVPHKLIIFVLQRYCTPPNWINLITLYYKGIYSKSSADSSRSGWHRHERGIFAGCTVSIILFLAGTNIILEYSIQTNASEFLSNGVPLSLL